MKIFELKSWYFYFVDEEEYLIAYGNAYDNPKFYRGQFIHTSMVMSIEMLEDRLRIHTRNSVYDCLYEEYVGQSMNFAETDYFPMPEPREENGEKLKEKLAVSHKEKLERDEQALTDGVADEDYCLVFEFSTEEEYYFKSVYVKEHGEEFYSRDHHVHVGTFQDSVLIESVYEDENCEFDYRFFPYMDNHLEFYSFTDFGGKMFVKNSGEQPLEVKLPFGRFLIPPGECYPVGKDTVLGRVTKSDKLPVDKHNIWDVVVHDNGTIGYTTPTDKPKE